jgi:predicted nuclease with TOPRIM domain
VLLGVGIVLNATVSPQSQTLIGKRIQTFNQLKEENVRISGRTKVTPMTIDMKEILRRLADLKASEQAGWSAFNKSEEANERLQKRIQKLEEEIEDLKYGG